MNIYVEFHQAHYLNGEILVSAPRLVIEHSPREQLDHEKIRKLENDVTALLEAGLNDAGCGPRNGGAQE